MQPWDSYPCKVENSATYSLTCLLTYFLAHASIVGLFHEFLAYSTKPMGRDRLQKKEQKS